MTETRNPTRSGFNRALWISGAPARALLLGIIWVYRKTLSPMVGGRCKYYPTCSHYAQDAIKSRGAAVGATLTVWRLLRCNPFSNGGVDKAPSPRSYANITQLENPT